MLEKKIMIGSTVAYTYSSWGMIYKMSICVFILHGFPSRFLAGPFLLQGRRKRVLLPPSPRARMTEKLTTGLTITNTTSSALGAVSYFSTHPVASSGTMIDK
jgi:hypothetical protein